MIVPEIITTEIIAANGWNFTVDMAGPDDGAPVLLLHGFPQSRHTWTAALTRLAAAGRRCYAPDQRGYSPGARPQPVEPYATDNLVADALALMDAVGAKSFHLVGHDWGGQLAWLIAAQAAPERVCSLTVLSRPHPAAFARAFREDGAQAARSGHHKAFQDSGSADRLRADDCAWLRRAFKSQGVPDANAERYLSVVAQPGALEGAIGWYQAAGAAGLRPESVLQVTVPTCYIWGDADATVGRFAAAATAEYVAGPYRFEVISDGGHFLTDDHPDETSAFIDDHIRTVAEAA